MQYCILDQTAVSTVAIYCSLHISIYNAPMHMSWQYVLICRKKVANKTRFIELIFMKTWAEWSILDFGITRENKNEINLRKMPKMYSSILKSIPSFSLPIFFLSIDTTITCARWLVHLLNRQFAHALKCNMYVCSVDYIKDKFSPFPFSST